MKFPVYYSAPRISSRAGRRLGMRPFPAAACPATLQVALEADAHLTVDNWPGAAGRLLNGSDALPPGAATAADYAA